MKNLDQELSDAAQAYQQGDLKSAYEKYHILAEGGHGDSQVFIGWMLANGIGIPADSDTAGIWFKRAALLGSIQGAFYYGLFLTKNGNHKDALKWYDKAANNGDVPSIFRLGYALVHGKGTQVDIKKGYKYLLSASKQGNIFAMREIGVLDLKGHRGLFHRLVGIGIVVYSIILGVITLYVDQYSERLRK